MNMFYTKSLFISILLFVGLNIYSQNDFESLGETSFSLNHSVNNDYKLNFSLRSRYFLYKDENFKTENRQVDIVHFSTYNLSYNKSLSLGIQYRLRENIDGGSNELRLTQQYNYTKSSLAVRYGHRFRLEQRILSTLTILRLRYRFSLDFPLNGEQLDLKETYLIASMEALLSTSKNIRPEVDHRTTAQIGYLLSNSIKIQLGLEYRFENFDSATEEKLFLLTSFILKI